MKVGDVISVTAHVDLSEKELASEFSAFYAHARRHMENLHVKRDGRTVTVIKGGKVAVSVETLETTEMKLDIEVEAKEISVDWTPFNESYELQVNNKAWDEVKEKGNE